MVARPSALLDAYSVPGQGMLLSALEVSDTQVHERYIRAILGTDAHFCQVVFLKRGCSPSRTPRGFLSHGMTLH